MFHICSYIPPPRQYALGLLPLVPAMGAIRRTGKLENPAPIGHNQTHEVVVPPTPANTSAPPHAGVAPPYRDPEGREIVAPYVAGGQRQGPPRGLTDNELQAVAPQFAGRGIEIGAPGGAHGIYRLPDARDAGRGSNTFAVGKIGLRDPNDAGALAHEIGHAIDLAARIL
jgi:hypothetical protein